MQSLRNSLLRSVAVWLVLPGYVLLLSADRRNDGSFACWLNLVLSSQVGVVASDGLNDAMKSADTVAEAIKNASKWAESQSAQNEAPTGRDSNTLYSLLIGEWKNYRQVNTSATTTPEQPEIRDGKALQRLSPPGTYAARPPELAAPPRRLAPAVEFETADLSVSARVEPMASGMAMGAP